MTFKDVYKFPLKVDEYCDIITWTADKQRAFDWCVNISPEKQQELIDVLNGTKQFQFKYKFYREGIEIHSENPIFKGKPVLLIRGWGYLTGIGGLHLPQEEAIKIQDDFGDYIVEQLNKNLCGGL
jgi:hypothetical protein